MQLEIRKWGEPSCEHCGATELVVSGRTSELLQKDLLPVVREELRRFETDLLAVARDRQDEILVEAEARIAALQDAFTQQVNDVFADHAPRFAPLRKRFHERLKEALDLATHDLVSETKY